MLRKIFIKISFLAILLSTFSCKKWLDLQPQDGITGAEFWQTKEQVQAAVTGMYSSLLGSPTGGTSVAESMFIWGEIRADMVSSAIGTTADQVAIMNVNIL